MQVVIFLLRFLPLFLVEGGEFLNSNVLFSAVGGLVYFKAPKRVDGRFDVFQGAKGVDGRFCVLQGSKEG